MSAARALAIAVSVGLALTVGACARPEPGATPLPSPGVTAETEGPGAPAPTASGSSAPPSATSPDGPGTASPGAQGPGSDGSASPRPAPAATGPGTVPPTPAAPASPAPTRSVPPAAPPSAATVPAAWRGIDLERIRTGERVVALTFDGGGSDAGVASILATLDREDVPATFFVTGAFARSFPQRVAAMAAAGHPVGNHSDTHPSFPDIRDTAIAAELARAEASIAAAGGGRAMPLFRFPFGARTPYDIGVVNELGYVPIRWSVDSLGWRGTAPNASGVRGSAEAVAARVIAGAQPGMIALMHVGANPDDGTTFDADALPAIIDGLRAAGYSFTDLRGLVR